MTFSEPLGKITMWNSIPQMKGTEVAPELSFAEVGEILSLLQRVEGAEVSLEWGDLKVSVRRGAPGDAAPQPVAPRPSPPLMPSEVSSKGGSDPSAEPQPEATSQDEADSSHDVPEHWVAVTAPMVGTFYHAPTPGEPPFVEVGDAVAPGDTVGLIEVMKLYTELSCEVAGKVARIATADSALVDYGQPLIWIEPA